MEKLYKTTRPGSPVVHRVRPLPVRAGLHLSPRLAGSLQYEPFRILEQVDSAKRYRLVLDASFPLAIKLYDFPAEPGAIPMTWHERLEIFCPLGGPGAFRIGDHLEPFEPGDILLIDNLRLHGVDNFRGPHREALVLVFSPEMVAAPGAPPCDLWLLRPFRQMRDGCLRLRARDNHGSKAWKCLSRLLTAQMEKAGDPARQAYQKHVLSELLIVFGEVFRDSIIEQKDYECRRDHLRRLQPLFDFLTANLHRPVSVPAAARLLRMSSSYFMRFFRTATGLTFSSYVNHLRVSRAYQLLVETDMPLADIAAETGFCDQCHFSRHIRRRFGNSPGRIRWQLRPLEGSASAPAVVPQSIPGRPQGAAPT